jgi:hypothetical protein
MKKIKLGGLNGVFATAGARSTISAITLSKHEEPNIANLPGLVGPPARLIHFYLGLRSPAIGESC